ncbi:MAG TPA: single-stranded-DNA-specific exonuclease RecJ [Phycisphaeraceae bacterium]
MQDAMMGRHWRWRGGGDDPPDHAPNAQALAQELGVHPLVARLLINRGLDRPDLAHAFLRPRLSDLHDPSLLPGIARAAQRIAQAIRDHQPIVIYGDYDVDGVTASAILWHTLRFAGAQVSTYIPHRLEEGYGLNCEAIAQLCQPSDGQSPKPLIISVDCGITAIEPAQVAQQHGVDLIITDHHTFNPHRLPPAHTLVHPRLEPGVYPCPDLCGAGVAFKLAWQTARAHCGSDRLPQEFRDLLMDLLSLAALGTVADVVPLVGENRIITIFGLLRIKQTRFAGLNALIDAARLRDEKIDAYHVGFVLGPRLNACGRMGHAKEAVRLLTEADEPTAAQLAAFLTAQNEQRRATERRIFQEAWQMVTEGQHHAQDRRAIVLGKEGWHPGVIGIVASRLVERFCRPVVLLHYDNGVAHGSARSVEGVSIHEAFAACAEYLDRFGGHAMAAGLALSVQRVASFREALIRFVNQHLSPEALRGRIEIDAPVTLDQCTPALFEQIQWLAPFGRGNPTPRLLLRQARLESPAQRLGASGQHLAMTLRQGRCAMRAVGFKMGDWTPHLPAGSVLDVVFEPHLSSWRGLRRCELHVQDLRLADQAHTLPAPLAAPAAS